jgi:lipid-A-disaccharide synthase-like uncharacterized protein
MDWHDGSFWLVIGFAGNAVFFLRFVVQWLASERAGRSYVPIAFWWLSIVGSLVLLGYAIHRKDPVFTLAFLPNCVVYVRNLMLIRKERLRLAERALERVGADPIWTAQPQPNAAPRPLER